MGIRSPFSKINKEGKLGVQVGPTAPIVDHGLGEAYETVEQVRTFLGSIARVADIREDVIQLAQEFRSGIGYSRQDHDHDLRYSQITHDHGELYQLRGDYAPLDHDHDGQYQPAGNYLTADASFDDRYQPLGDYAPAAHTHHDLYLTLDQKGALNGLATLDGTGKVPTSQIPALAISKPTVVGSQAAQLALTAQEGDIAIRSDQKKNYIHNGGTAGTMADWTALEGSISDVMSVNGQTGIVVLGKGDVGLGNVDNTADSGKVVLSASRLTTARKINGVDFNGTSDILINAVDATARIAAAEKGQANGVATLGADGKVPASQLPAAANPATSFDALTDVVLTGRVNGSIPKWNSTTAKWEMGADLVGSGGGAGTDYASFAQFVINRNTIFNGTGVPVWIVPKSAGLVTEIADASTVGGTHALTFGDGTSRGNYADDWFEFPVYSDGTTNNKVTIRYRTQGENGYDGIRINVDGAQVHQQLAGDSGWVDWQSAALTAGLHTIRVRYTSDLSNSGGWQNLRIARIIAPIEEVGKQYQHGDTVTHAGSKWLVLQTGVTTAPDEADTTKWLKLSGGGGAGAVATDGSAFKAGQGSTYPAFRMWRINVTSWDGGEQYTSLADLQFRVEKGVATQNTGGTPITSGILGGFPVSNAFDTDLNSTYISNSGAPNWVGYDFGVSNTRVIRQVALRTRPGYPLQFPKNFTVQGSNDGVTWTTQWTVSGGLYAAGAINTARQEITSNPAVEALTERYPTRLRALTDVVTTAPAEGQLLAFDLALAQWKPVETIALAGRVRAGASVVSQGMFSATGITGNMAGMDWDAGQSEARFFGYDATAGAAGWKNLGFYGLSSVRVRINSVLVADFTNGGLAVTGSITASGKLGIGGAAGAYQATITGDKSVLRLASANASFGEPQCIFAQGSVEGIFTATGNGFEVGTYSGHDTIFRHAQNEKARLTTAGLEVTGNITATGSITPGSDEKLKEDIEPITGALDTVCALEGVNYKLKSDGLRTAGVIAQQVQPHVPELVVDIDEDLLGMNYNGLTAYLIEAIKELRAEVKDLRTQIYGEPK